MVQLSNISCGGFIRVEVIKNKGSGLDGLHVRNQVTINDEKIGVFEESYMDTVSVV